MAAGRHVPLTMDFMAFQALESKLASCRNFVKEQPRNNKSGSSSPLNSPR